MAETYWDFKKPTGEVEYCIICKGIKQKEFTKEELCYWHWNNYLMQANIKRFGRFYPCGKPNPNYQPEIVV